MAATVIDSLLVTLGLDPRPYQKSAKEAERQQKQFKDSVKKGGNEISDALANVGRQAALLFLGFEGIKGAINFFAGLSVASADLGRFSKNIGESAHEVNAWDSAVELAGGSAKDAEGDLRSLSGSITALKTMGDVSPMLLKFSQLGVAIFDAQGKTRKLTDIFKDFGTVLRGYNRADAFNLAQQAGLSESTFNLITSEANERERILRTAEANNAVTEESVAKAAKLQEQWRGIGQTIKGAAIGILEDFTPGLMSAFSWIQKIFTGVKNTGVLQGAFAIIGGALRVIVDLGRMAVNGWKMLFNLFDSSKNPVILTLKFFGHKIADFGRFLKGFGPEFVAEADKLAGRADESTAAPATAAANRRTLGLRNNNPGNLRFAGQAGATLGEGGFAKFTTLGKGIQAANRQLDLYAKRGINTISAIVSKWAPTNENDTQGYIGRLEKQLGIDRNRQLTAADRQRLLSAIFNQGEGNKVPMASIAGALAPKPGALQAAQFASAQTVQASTTAQNTSHETNVQIDQITVNTQATDARGVAAELPNALRRKGVVAQADSGLS